MAISLKNDPQRNLEEPNKLKTQPPGVGDFQATCDSHLDKDIWQLTPRGWNDTFAPKALTPSPTG